MAATPIPAAAIGRTNKPSERRMPALRQQRGAGKDYRPERRGCAGLLRVAGCFAAHRCACAQLGA